MKVKRNRLTIFLSIHLKNIINFPHKICFTRKDIPKINLFIDLYIPPIPEGIKIIFLNDFLLIFFFAILDIFIEFLNVNIFKLQTN